MILWNGDYKTQPEDKCSTCLYPSSCAMIDLMLEHSKEVAKWSNKEIEVEIKKCPCRDIKT